MGKGKGQKNTGRFGGKQGGSSIRGGAVVRKDITYHKMLKQALTPTEYDEKLMAEILKLPQYRKRVADMSPEMLDMFKNLLVHKGVYSAYVANRNRDILAGLAALDTLDTE